MPGTGAASTDAPGKCDVCGLFYAWDKLERFSDTAGYRCVNYSGCSKAAPTGRRQRPPMNYATLNRRGAS